MTVKELRNIYAYVHIVINVNSELIILQSTLALSLPNI